MFRIIALLEVCSLLVLQGCIGKGAAREHNKTPITVEDVLSAYRINEDPAIASVFTAEAIRKVSLRRALSGFERLIKVSRNGRLFRYERTAESGPTKQIDVFDGNWMHHLMSANGKLIESSTRPGESASEQVMHEIKTFGLLPILNRLMDVKPQSEFEDGTGQGLDRVRLKIADRTWDLSIDAEHLVRRLEFPDNAIDFSDYREIQGVQLPFKQRFFSRGQLYYELTFTRVDLKPIFPEGYFTREAAISELTR
jgi:hypothetical protein